MNKGQNIYLILVLILFFGCEGNRERQSSEIFQAAVQAEINNDLYTAIGLFDSLTRTYPDTKYFMQANIKRQSLKTSRESTIRAWQTIQSIDLAHAKVQPMSQQYKRLADSYSQVDLPNVDIDLANHIQESIDIFLQLSRLLMQAEIADTLKKSQYTKKELFQVGAIASNFQTRLEEFNISKVLRLEKLNKKYHFPFRDS
jgi:hypothetical protein